MNKVLNKNLSALFAFVLALSCFTGLVFANAQDGVEINAVNFPDDHFRSVVEERYDTNKDLFLSPEETAQVTNMPLFVYSIPYGQITDLKGIEYFTNLKELYAGALGLESVDLSALQNLEYLTINGNALTSLDLSANTALKTLYCFGNSELASLILPAGITDLQCYGCALTSLDVSACTGLTRLSCHTNQITALDLSHNPALQTLICSDNCLTYLDLSANTQLTNVTQQNIGNQSVTAAAAANGKTFSVPVSGLLAQNVVEPSAAGEYNAQTGAFEFSDYSAAQNGFDYAYNVGLSGAANMNVHVNVTKDFYKVSYYDAQGGSLIDYLYVTAGGDSAAPAFPQAPSGYVCPSWSADGKNITADTDIYVVWNAQHSYEVMGYEEFVATARCSVCGEEYTISLEDCYNAKQGDANYDSVMDVNSDGYINARDHSILQHTFK